MARPTSFRLPDSLLDQLMAAAAERRVPVTALVTSMLEEGLKTGRFPGIVYREGPAGRRAGLAGGPDVWEVVKAFKQAGGSAEQRLATLTGELALADHRIGAALDFYAAFLRKWMNALEPMRAQRRGWPASSSSAIACLRSEMRP